MKINSIYGEVDTDADVLGAFYSARQGPEETLADWGCLLESLFDFSKRQANIPGNHDETLRNMLCTGLRQDLRDVSVYHHGTVKSFDQLLTTLRRVEKQHMKSTPAEKPKIAPRRREKEQRRKI